MSRRHFMGAAIASSAAWPLGRLGKGSRSRNRRRTVGTRARIATVCQGRQFKPTVEGNVQYVMSLLDRALKEKPDLVCLPEAFHDVAVSRPISETAEPMSGPTLEAFGR